MFVLHSTGVITAGLILFLVGMIASDQTMESITRQIMLQQLFVEERVRSGGNSGIKGVRIKQLGTQNYHSENHASSRMVVAIHNHDNNERIAGMGEVIAVLNGVEFRTRHNDFGIRQPSKTSAEYHKTDDIAFPPVPPSVTEKSTVEEQMQEMREYFKAWKTEDTSHRDYKEYFKANLCYLEGAWTYATDDIEEAFESDRHFLDGVSFFDLAEKIRFTSYSGGKDLLENFAFLPTTIIQMTNSTPIFAQWNYRIMCHPLEKDVPISRLHLKDDLSIRARNMWTTEQMEASRAAHFIVNPQDQEEFEDGRFNYGLLDELMEEIPGKDNYGAVLYDDAFSIEAYHYKNNTQKLNTAYYHRFYQGKDADAMGTTNRKRGYGDDNMFMAQTTQGKIAAPKIDICPGEDQPCYIEQKWSYAFPLEIIYLTPLSAWNPYDIEYKGKFNTDAGKTVTANGRNGGYTNETALNGTNSKNFYRTPYEFFEDDNLFTDPADTTVPWVGALDSKGDIHKMSSTGARIFFPSIPGVGITRQRYPIFPTHGEGSSEWKALEALSDIAMRPLSHGFMFNENPADLMENEGETSNVTVLKFQLKPSYEEYGSHIHDVYITANQLVMLNNGMEVPDVVSEKTNGHTHTLTLFHRANSDDTKPGTARYSYCDNNDREKVCSDGHWKSLQSLTVWLSSILGCYYV